MEAMRCVGHSGASRLAPPPTERHAGVSATPAAQVAPLRGIRRGTGPAGGGRVAEGPPSAAHLAPRAHACTTQTDSSTGGWRQGPLLAVPAAWASWSGHRRPAGRTRGQGSEARAHAGGGRRGACRGLGFTGPHGRAGGELRPPVALGAESHPRPRPKPRVIFNQRRHPGYHPGARGQGAGGAGRGPTLRRQAAGRQRRTRSGPRGSKCAGACRAVGGSRERAASAPIGPSRTRAWGGAAEISRHLAWYKDWLREAFALPLRENT